MNGRWKFELGKMQSVFSFHFPFSRSWLNCD